MDRPDLDALDALLAKAQVWPDSRQGTHWDGCEEAHARCMIHKLTEALPALLARVRELEYGLDDAQKLRNIWQNVSRELATDCDVLREIVQSAIALLEIDAEADDPATDVYAFLKHARAKVTP